MSLKDNVEYVKDELNTQEKFLENFVKTERFFKKYKKLILSLLVILVVAIIALIVMKTINEKNKIEANIAFENFLQNNKDSNALEVLKNTNKKLYEIAIFLNSKNEGKIVEVDVPFLKELSIYQKALEENSLEKLNNVSMQNDFLLKEFAIFNKALILAQEGKIEESKTTLTLIPQTSKAYELANLLNHYLATK